MKRISLCSKSNICEMQFIFSYPLNFLRLHMAMSFSAPVSPESYLLALELRCLREGYGVRLIHSKASIDI